MKITDEMLFKHASEARNIWLSTLPSQEEIPAISYSKSFERKMQKLIREQRRTPSMNRILRYVKQTVVAVLAVAIFTFGGLMTVDAYRAKVINFVVDVFNELTQYRFSSDLPDSNSMVLPEISFGYVPEGMEEVKNRLTSTGQRQIVYENDADDFFKLTQKSLSNSDQFDVILDTEESVYKVGSIQGCEAFFNTKGDDSSIIWVDENVIYSLFGNIDLSELKMVADRIKIISN